MCVDENARLNPEAHRVQLRDFLTPTGDSDADTQAPPNRLYKDNFKAVDKFNARMASAPAAWRLKSERQRWLIGFVQVALSNAYALYRNNAILAGVAPDNILNMNQFAVQVGEGVYRGDV